MFMPRSHRWTSTDLTDQSGRVFVVTGANTGIGFATTRALAGRGARVIMACRNLQKAEAAQASLPAAARERTEVWLLDLADLDSVSRFVDEVSAGPDALERIDVLINNAGVMNLPHARTAQGHEMQFGVNTLGHHALTLGLEPLLRDRVVWLGSLSHLWGRVDTDDLSMERRGYSPMRAYGSSKLACLMLAYEWQRHFDREGSDLRSVAAHPGYTATELIRHSGRPLADRFFELGNSIPGAGLTPDQGSLPVQYAATVPDIAGGAFVGPDRLGGLRGLPEITWSTARSHDRALAATLWRRCSEMVAFR